MKNEWKDVTLQNETRLTFWKRLKLLFSNGKIIFKIKFSVKNEDVVNLYTVELEIDPLNEKVWLK